VDDHESVWVRRTSSATCTGLGLAPGRRHVSASPLGLEVDVGTASDLEVVLLPRVINSSSRIYSLA